MEIPAFPVFCRMLPIPAGTWAQSTVLERIFAEMSAVGTTTGTTSYSPHFWHVRFLLMVQVRRVKELLAFEMTRFHFRCLLLFLRIEESWRLAVRVELGFGAGCALCDHYQGQLQNTVRYRYKEAREVALEAWSSTWVWGIGTGLYPSRMSDAAVERSRFRFIRSTDLSLWFQVDWENEFFSFTFRCHLL